MVLKSGKGGKDKMGNRFHRRLEQFFQVIIVMAFLMPAAALFTQDAPAVLFEDDFESGSKRTAGAS